MKKDCLSQTMLAISIFGKISPIRFKKLIRYFPKISCLEEIDFLKLKKIGLKENLITDFINFKKNFSVHETLINLQNEKINFTHLFAEDYPKILKEISDPPIVLYYRGRISPWPKNALAVIGARKNSYYGEKVIQEILKPFSSSNLAVISGLALGIDTIAHQNSLTNDILTFAVLGSGIDNQSIYPPENRLLAKRIIENGGAIISEFPPGTKPEKYNFPIRNRIIAGLSKAVLIVEAEEKSGSLITAKLALEENRDILAIPGTIFSALSRGTNQLISLGAKAITQSSDILNHFPEIKKIEKPKIINEVKENELNEEEILIYSLIKEAADDNRVIDFDEIAFLSKLDSASINSTLSILEIAGMIRREGPAHTII